MLPEEPRKFWYASPSMLWDVILNETFLIYTAPNPVDPAEVLILTNKSKLGELENHPILGLLSSKAFYMFNIIRCGYNIIFQLGGGKCNSEKEKASSDFIACRGGGNIATCKWKLLCLTAVLHVLKLCQTTVDCSLASTYISGLVSLIK